jgi:eukaryotic-like serine/threonine-protein kinase
VAQCVVCSTEIKDDARFCPSCGAEQPRMEVAGTDADPLMGKVVARKFQVEKLLGVGGMGKVYKARQLTLDKAVVVKVLHDHFRDDPQLVQRFQREAKAASRLNHPNSIQIIDFGQDDGGVVFMAMEFLQGQDLFALLKKEGPLPPDRLAKVMLQVCSALAEAHEQNVIHRDLKPENIMVEDRRGQKDFVKVLDFGIAKIQDPGEGQQQLTQAGMVCGTPEYMSPEQARGLQLDPRSDIYALGVVMYQLAVGELPFVADTPIGIVTKHILEKPVPPRERAPQLNIPEELEGIILKAMEKEADKRFSTVSELGEALENLLRSMNVSLGAFGGGRAPGAHESGAHARPATSGGLASTPTRPTPTGAAGAVTAASSTAAPTGAAAGAATGASTAAVIEHRDAAAQAGGAGGGLKLAAIAFVAVIVVAGAAVAAIKVLGGEETTADAGSLAVLDAGSQQIEPPAADGGAADRPPAIVDAGVAEPPPVADAGTAPDPVKPDPVKPDPVKPDPVKPDPPKSNRAAAEKIFRDAHAKFVAGDCDAAMPLLGKAAQLDPSYGEPLRDIAMCQKKAGSKDRACSAAKEFVRRKKMTGVNADNTLAVFCN